MRVAYICCDPGVPIFGCKGCSVHVQEVTKELIRRGCHVDILAASTGGVKSAEMSAASHHRIPCLTAKDAKTREQIQLQANAKVLRLLESLGPFDLVYERYSLHAFAGMQYAQATGARSILEVNSPLIDEQERYRQLDDRESAEESTWQAMTRADAVVAVSERVAEYVRLYRAAEGSIHVIANGVDVRRFANCDVPRNPKTDESLTIGFVGTLKQWHGVAGLIEAYYKVASTRGNTRLLIVGEGPERTRLEQLAADLLGGYSHQVVFTGAVAPDQIPPLLADVDVAVAPYSQLADFYFSPLKIYEYMAAGLPTVVSRVGQIPDLIQDDITGMLYTPGDTAGLADALVTLIDHPEKRLRLGSAARRKVTEQSTWQAVVSRILSIPRMLPAADASKLKPHFQDSARKVAEHFSA